MGHPRDQFEADVIGQEVGGIDFRNIGIRDGPPRGAERGAMEGGFGRDENAADMEIDMAGDVTVIGHRGGRRQNADQQACSENTKFGHE